MKPNAAPSIKWKLTASDANFMRLVCERASPMIQRDKIDYDRRSLEMDLTAAHLNGCPLDLQKLAGAPEADFGHDIYGIRRFLDRKTGQIDDRKFSPRCSQPS